MAGFEGEGAIVIRDAKLMPINVADVALRGEVSRNVFLRDGDLIYIPDKVAKKMFVLGEVQRPEAVQIERNAVPLAEEHFAALVALRAAARVRVAADVEQQQVSGAVA